MLAAGLLYLAFRNVDFQDFWSKTKEVDYSWIYLSIGISVIPHIMRAYRWNLLLAPMGYENLKTSRTMLAVLIGYLANLALPRLGEVSRCVALQRNDKVKFSEGLGTVITERAFDMLTLLGIIAITFIVEFDKLEAFFQEYIFSKINLSTPFILGLVLAGIIGIIALIFIRKKFFSKDSPSNKLLDFVREIVKGLSSIRNVRNIWAFGLATVLIWVGYYFMSYLIVFSLPETSHLGWLAGLALLVTGGIGMAAPVQGGIGTFHLFVSAMLISYGVDKQSGIFLATLLHTSQVVAIVLFGAFAMIVSVFLRRNQKNEPDTQ